MSRSTMVMAVIGASHTLGGCAGAATTSTAPREVAVSRPASSSNPATPRWSNPAEEALRRAERAEFEGRHADALESYLWCLDNCHIADEAFAGVRVSVVPRNIARLGGSYPPALAQLTARREGLEQAMRRSNVDPVDALLLHAINVALREPQRTAALYVELRDGPRGTKANLDALFEPALEHLFRQSRHDLIAERMGLIVTALERLTWERNNAGKVQFVERPEPQHARLFIGRACIAYSSALQLRAPSAARLREAALDLSFDVDTLACFHRAAAGAGAQQELTIIEDASKRLSETDLRVFGELSRAAESSPP